jgi:hypothetical protein
MGPTGPRLGAYAGWLGRDGLSALAPPGLLASLRHGVRERRWQQALLVTPAHLVVVAIVDAGPIAAGTLWLVDRASGEVLFDRTAPGLPGLNARVADRPGAGARASFAAPGMDLLLERRSDRFQLTADLGPVRLDAYLDTRGTPDPFALVAPLPEAGVRVAQLSGPLRLSGHLEVRGQRHLLEDGLAALDFGAGVFPREVAWRRLTAAGRLEGGAPVLLHLAEGLGGLGPEDGGEDVLLGEGGPRRLPAVAIEADPRSATAPWQLASRDGAIALSFQPQASHREARHLLLLSTRRTQLLGTLSGRLPAPGGGVLEVRGLPALAEDLAARW